MSASNPEYDFKWCPGCGDFGVPPVFRVRGGGLGAPLRGSHREHRCCGGNRMLRGTWSICWKGRSPSACTAFMAGPCPLRWGSRWGRPDLNVVIVAGDGDFLSIGAEHIAPQAARNLDVCAVIMDNGVYGLTKGQSSPTSELGMVTSSTPYGKIEESMNPMGYYMSLGMSFIASGISSKPKDVAHLITAGMEHRGFAMVHIQSPCTTYNDNYEILKGNAKKGIEPLTYAVPEEHDPSDRQAAFELCQAPGIPLGIIYQDANRPAFHDRLEEMRRTVKPKSVQDLIDSYQLV